MQAFPPPQEGIPRFHLLPGMPAGKKLPWRTDIPPGLIAEIYRRRWDIESTYKVLKHKFGEIRAWASSAIAKEAQALFICLAHNLILATDHHLRIQEGITDQTAQKRRDQRTDQRRNPPQPEPAQPEQPSEPAPLPTQPPAQSPPSPQKHAQPTPTLQPPQSATGQEPKAEQAPATPTSTKKENPWSRAHPSIGAPRRKEMGVKFLRWIADNLFQKRPWQHITRRLAHLYASSYSNSLSR